MQITLNQAEILSALDSYVRDRITIAPNQKIEIDMKAGRSENGFTATLEIVAMNPAEMMLSGAALPPAHAYPETVQAGEAAQAQTTSAGPADVIPAKKAGIFNKPKAVVNTPAPIIEAVEWPKEEPTAVAQTIMAEEARAEEALVDSGPIEVNNLEDEPGSEETQPGPVEAAPVKKSIFSKAS